MTMEKENRLQAVLFELVQLAKSPIHFNSSWLHLQGQQKSSIS